MYIYHLPRNLLRKENLSCLEFVGSMSCSFKRDFSTSVSNSIKFSLMDTMLNILAMFAVSSAIVQNVEYTESAIEENSLKLDSKYLLYMYFVLLDSLFVNLPVIFSHISRHIECVLIYIYTCLITSHSVHCFHNICPLDTFLAMHRLK